MTINSSLISLKTKQGVESLLSYKLITIKIKIRFSVEKDIQNRFPVTMRRAAQIVKCLYQINAGVASSCLNRMISKPLEKV